MAKLLALLLFLASSLVFAQPVIPHTPAGKVFAAWFDSYNSAERARIQAFQDAYKRKTPVEDVLSWREDTGGYRLISVQKTQPLAIGVLLRERKNPDVSATMTISLKTPDTIDKVEFNELPIPRLTQTKALATLIRRADELTKADRFSGAMLIARNGKVLLEKGWGKADRAAGKPVTPATQFRLASVNKMFTSVAILQLVEAGKLSLDDTVGKHFSDYPNSEVARAVTVRELLSHTSGLPDIEFSDTPNYKATRDALRTHEDYVQRYAPRILTFKPGSKFEYVSYDFVLLGALIEKISGMSYYEYVQRHIYDPAGMTSTGSLPESIDVPNRAVGYMQQNGKWVANTDTLPYRGTAAGGGYSTVGDLFRFAQALQAGKLVSKSLLAEATTPQTKGGWYGYGFTIIGRTPPHGYGHGGDSPGMNASIGIFPNPGYVVVALSNLDPPAAYEISNYYESRMPIVE